MIKKQELTGVMIGAGYFAGFQAQAWRDVPGARMVAVADLMPDRARAFADRWGIPRVYTDAAEMLEKERPDFADIVTRPDSHLPLSSLCAERGVNVICQKPLAPTLAESIEIERVCRRHGVRLLVHENWRWQPWYRETRRLLDAGVIGTPYFLGFHMRTGDGRGPEPYTVQPYFRDMEKLLVYETAVHFLDTFRYLAGEITSVSCRMKRINPVIKGEDLITVQLATEAGTEGSIDANRISGPVPSPFAFNSMRFEGDRGMVRLDTEAKLWVTEYGQAERPHQFSWENVGYRGNCIGALQADLVARLADGRPAETEGAAYLRTVATVFACYESARLGHPVAPDSLLASA